MKKFKIISNDTPVDLEPAFAGRHASVLAMIRSFASDQHRIIPVENYHASIVLSPEGVTMLTPDGTYIWDRESESINLAHRGEEIDRNLRELEDGYDRLKILEEIVLYARMSSDDLPR